MSQPTMNKSDRYRHALRFLQTVFTPGDIIELRALTESGPATVRLYRNLDTAAKGAIQSNEAGVNIYFCLNPIAENSSTVLLNPVDTPPDANAPTRAAKDSSIARRTLYLIDVDPVRKSDTSSTDDELAAARKVATKVRTLLSGLKWPEPIQVCSGNGIHLLYRGDGCSPHSDSWKFALKYLSNRFSTAQVKIDTSVSNAARISRLPGCWNRKGPNSESRPHRLAMVESYPETWTPLQHQFIYKMASDFGYSQKETFDSRARNTTSQEVVIDEDGVRELIEEFPDQLSLSRVTHDGDETWFALAECPFKGEAHKGMNVGKGKTALVLGPDRFGFSCFSDDCRDHSIGDLLRHLHHLTGRWPSMDIWDFDWEAAFKKLGVEDVDAEQPMTVAELRQMIETGEPICA
jgi:hypothetical protein